MTQLTEYDKQAINFLEETDTKIDIKYDDTYDRDNFGVRDNYDITLTRGDRQFSFKFSQSLYHSGKSHIVKDIDKGIHKTIHGIAHDNKSIHILYESFKDFSQNKQFIDRLVMKALYFDGPLKHIKNQNFQAPREYDILACLTKYDPGDFENFCSDYGYNTDSIRAKQTYDAVLDEWRNICILWNDAELEILREVQ